MITKISKLLMISLVMVVLFFGALVVASLLPIPGNISLFTVLSGSMEPVISTGSTVIVKSANTYEIGDIVTRDNGEDEMPVTHRIVGQSEKNGVIFFQTQGDTNNMIDTEEVTADMIVGRVIIDIPYVGYLTNFARTKQGFLLFIIIPAVILIYEETKKITKELGHMSTSRKREKKQERDDLMTAELCAQFVEQPMMQTRHKPKKIIKIV